MMEHEAFGYQWVRKSTGEFYRGIHKGSLEDNYAGSGVLFNKKFGGRRRTECKDPEDWVRGVEVSEETRQKISATSKGRKHLDTTKRKQSEARKVWWAKRKETTMEGEVDVK